MSATGATTATITPATVCFHYNDVPERKRKRMVPYARLSTAEEKQLTSYKVRVSYYTQYMQTNSRLDTSRGVCGRRHLQHVLKTTRELHSHSHRCAIDLPAAKSVSCFACNVVDDLTTVRWVKEKDVYRAP